MGDLGQRPAARQGSPPAGLRSRRANRRCLPSGCGCCYRERALAGGVGEDAGTALAVVVVLAAVGVMVIGVVRGIEAQKLDEPVAVIELLAATFRGEGLDLARKVDRLEGRQIAKDDHDAD